MDLKWQLALLSMRTKKFFQKTGRKITINGSDTARYDKVNRGPRNQRNRSTESGQALEEDNKCGRNFPFSKAMLAIGWSCLDKLIGSQIPNKSKKGLGFVSYNVVPPPPTGLFSPLNLDLSNSGLEEFQQPNFEGYGPKTSKSVSKDTSNELFCLGILPKCRLQLQLPSKGKEVNTARGKVNTTRPKAVNTARPNTAEVMADRTKSGNALRPQPIYIKKIKDNVRQLNAQAHEVDMSYLSDFKEFNRGYVTFRGGAKGGRFTGNRTFKTGKLDFEDVYFVKELQFNLLSVSQMCDKKNNVLFTDTRCFVLSPDFKLADESQVLLKVPRKNNMYSIDMKNIVPKESLTCLVAKVTLDESMLWHRRLGHIENLVDKKVKIIRYDNGTEFKNRVMSKFCKKKGIKREFSVARTPQQNAINTACYVQNMVLVVKPYNKTPCELFRGRTPSLCFIKPFRCYVTILNTLDHLGKFDGKFDNGFFVGYSLNSKAFRVQKKVLVQIILVRRQDLAQGRHFGCHYGKMDSLIDSLQRMLVNDEHNLSNDRKRSDYLCDEPELDLSNIAIIYPVPTTPNTRIHKDHSLDHVFGDVQSGVQTRRMINEQGFISVVYEVKNHEDLHTCLLACFLSQEESKKCISDGKIEKESMSFNLQDFEDLEFLDKVYKEKSIIRSTQSLEPVTQKDDGIFINQDKYVDEILKKFGFSTMKTASTPMETSKLLFKDAKAEDVMFTFIDH
ncbi:ribonuclease H-like domain-containing protein [Tanacetum coccineum]